MRRDSNGKFAKRPKPTLMPLKVPSQKDRLRAHFGCDR